MSFQINDQHSKITIDSNSNELLESLLVSSYSKAKKIIITDENVFELWLENFLTAIPSLSEAEIIQLPAGEETKCINIANHIWESLSDYKINRNDVIINFGGGVITDLGGFIAATYKRGINFINIPTTLLSQVDASVGGKTGIDIGPNKNQVGCFAHPSHIIINPNYLKTLTESEMLSGYAEMLKHGLIQSKSHWNKLKENKANITEKLIFESIEIKASIIKKDPFEKNIRKSLNFGHTIGHAIEGYFLSINQSIPHGFAVAWGMMIESYLSLKKNLINKVEWNEIYFILSDIYSTPNIDKNAIQLLIELMKNDKKNDSSSINFTLLNGIGTCLIDQTASEEEIIEAITFVI